MRTNLLKQLMIVCISFFALSNAYGQSASCDTLYNYVNGDQFYNFSGSGGTALGHDRLSDNSTVDAWAEPYFVSASTEVRALYFAPWTVNDAGGAVTFKVYDNNAGEPGAELATELVTMSEFTKNVYYKVEFTSTATVNGDFFVGYELAYTSPQDSFAISGTFKPGGVNFTQFKNNGVWGEVVDTYTVSGDPFVSAWSLRVLTSNAPAPTADYTINTGTVCLGGADFLPDGNNPINSDYYEYKLWDYDVTTIYVEEEGATPTITPTVADTSQILALYAHGGCTSDVKAFYVDVLEPITASHSVVNTTCGNNNGSITVTNPTGGSGAYSYSINGSTPQSNPTFTGLSSGNHTVVVRSSGLGCSYSMSINVPSTPQEIINVNPGSVICAGESVNVSASGNGTIEWFESGTSIGTGTSLSVSPSMTTIYDATLTDANGCTDTKQVTVTVNALPTVSAGADIDICAGENTNITATGAVSYSWDNGLGAGATHSVTPSAQTTYVVTGTDANGCENTDQVTVDVHALPTISASSDVTICEGESTVVSATGGSTYAWDNGLGAGASHSVTPSAQTTYAVTGTDANGCTASDQVTVNVNAFPVISAGSDVAICLGDNATISASGGTAYTWDNGLGAGASHTVSPSGTTTYQVTGTGANGCENTSFVTVTVNPYDDASFTFNNFCELSTTNGPSNIITPGGTFSFNPVPADGATINPTTGEISNGVNGANYTVEYTTNGSCPSTSTATVSVQSNDDPSFSYDNICLGNGLTVLPSNIATPGGTYAFYTAPTDGATINTSTGEVLNPTLGTTYAIEYTTPTGACQSSTVQNITVYTAPTVSLSATVPTICMNESTDLQATGNATNYTWNNGLNNGTTHSVSPSTTTTYTVTGTDANGCTNSASQTINVNSLPIVDAGADQTVCENETVNMTATGAVSYVWDNGLGNGATQSFSATITETYTVTGTDANNCENSDQITITVNALPVVDAGQDVSICNGDQITLTANGANTYNWDNGLGAGAAHNVSPTITTTYTVTGTGLNACENTDQITVTVTNIPTVNAGVDQTVCENSEVTLTATSSTGSTVTWDNGIVDGTPFTVTTSTTYTATADLNGCTATDQVVINVNPLPSVSAGNNQTACTNHDPIALTGSPAGGIFSGTGVSNNEFDPATAGIGTHTLTYAYTDGNGCENTASITITVDGCVAVVENEMNQLTVSPNPASDYIEVRVNENNSIQNIQIISLEGKVVSLEQTYVDKATIKIDVSTAAKGTYFIQLTTDYGYLTRKIIVQ